MTNILRLPVVEKALITRTNVDWTDSWYFYGAGSALGVPDPTNTGNGTIGSFTVDPAAPVRQYRVRITSVIGGMRRYAVLNLDNALLVEGVVGTPGYINGVGFTVVNGSTGFVVGDTLTLTVLGAPMDISGIRFDMMLRRSRSAPFAAYPPTVPLTASTLGSSPMLLNGTASGVLSAIVPRATMQGQVSPGLYDYDILATAEGRTVLAALGTLRHDYGVTTLAA